MPAAEKAGMRLAMSQEKQSWSSRQERRRVQGWRFRFALFSPRVIFTAPDSLIGLTVMASAVQGFDTARAGECATKFPLHARLRARFSGAFAMVIQPKVRGFLCTTTHPMGCFENVRRQARHVRSKGDIADGPKRVLVLGASTGYGLASRITAAFGAGASTIGVFFEKAGTDRKPGTAGWYNSAALNRPVMCSRR